MAEKGALTKEQERLYAVVADDVVKAKGIVEFVDGYLARIIITLIDDQLVEKLKADVKEKLGEIATFLLVKDWDGAKASAGALLNLKIDIPGLDEDAEALLFNGALDLLVGAVLKWIADKQAVA